MRRILFVAILCVAGAGAGCVQAPRPEQPPAAQKPAAPTIPPEIQGAAEAVLGLEVEVLVHGDLARNGNEQALGVNRLKRTPAGAVPGVLLTRAALVEKEGGKWKEVFRCDEHLKNPRGFLAATPISPVAGWRLQYEQSAEKGLVMYFTPLEQPAGGYVQTIGVRWNPRAKRYQSLDRSYERFLGEVPALETLQFDLRKR